MKHTFEDKRREYTRGGLRRKDLLADPIEQFDRWFEQAEQAGLSDPTAMTLATVDGEGQPSQRIVLLKHLDADGFVFYTHTDSRKGLELAANPRASLHFPWHNLDRQVKIAGIVHPLERQTVSDYFHSRPRESQLAAWASEQSGVIESRQALMQAYDAVKARFADGPIPLPENWGGYCLEPREIEFWQGGAYRLHDCFRYTRTSNTWQIDRLAP